MDIMDKEQCAAIWEQYEPYLRRIAGIKLQSCPDAIDDMIAEVFLALCKKVEESGYPENSKAWLYGTLNHLINGKYRELYKEKEHTIVLTEQEYKLPYGEDFVGDIEDEWLLEQVRSVMEQELSEREKTLLRLLYDDELSEKQAAGKLGLSDSAVKQQHYRLRRHIRAIAKKLMKS